MYFTSSLLGVAACFVAVQAIPKANPQAASTFSQANSTPTPQATPASLASNNNATGSNPTLGAAALDQKAVIKAVGGGNLQDNVAPNPSKGPVTTTLNRNSMPPFKASGSWTSAACTASAINDANAPGDQRWAAADASDALQQIVSAFANPQLSNPAGDYPEDLPGFIWNAFHYNDAPDCGNIADANCDVTEQCGNAAGAPPAIFLIMNSITYIHRIVNQQYQALSQAATTIQGQMKDMVDTFAPQPPPQMSEEILKVLLDSVTFGVGVGSAYFWNVAVESLKILANSKAVRGALKDSFNAGVAFAFTGNKDAMKTDPSKPDDLAQTLSDFLSQYFAQTQNYTAQWLLNTISVNDTGNATVLTNLIDDGLMLLAEEQLPNNTGGPWGDVVTSQATFLYGNLIPAAWSLSPKNYKPFVLRVDKNTVACNDPLPKSSHFDGKASDLLVGDVMSDDTAKNNRWCDGEGNSWFLLTAHYSDDCATGGCVGGSDLAFQSMDGSDPANLDGTKWGGITMKDMILSSYGGFVKNGNKNGFTMDPSSTDIVNDNFTITDTTDSGSGLILSGGPLTPGFFNFTICLDYKEALNTISSVWSHGDQSAPVCGTSPSSGGVSSNVGPPGSVNFGKCGVHVTQYQKNEGDENLSGQYETQITITDGAGETVGEANKEPNGRPVIVVDSSLPYDLVVDAGGSTDSDPVQFWYADQFWDSNGGGCKVGAYDSGHRDMDCSFQCPAPPANSAQPSPSATIAHALPSGAANAAAGPNSFVNTYITTSATPTSASSTASPTPSYIQGWCGYHLTQYQRNEPNGENPLNDYQIEVTVYEASTDANKHQPAVIATLGKTDAPTGKGVDVTGKLQYELTVTMEGVDSDPIDFAYGGTTWKSSDIVPGNGQQRCQTGSKNNGYQDGKREMDCGFDC